MAVVVDVLEGFVELLSIKELLMVRMVGMDVALLEEERTGSSSSASWGVNATSDVVGTSPRMSERT